MADEQNPDDPQKQKQKVQSPGSKEQASAYSNKNNLGEITSQNKIGDDTGVSRISATSTVTATDKEAPSLMGEQQSDTMTTPKTFPDTNRVRANEMYKETGHVAKPSDEQDDEGDSSGQQASKDEDYKREQYKVSAERISDQARQEADERGGTPMEKEEARQKEEREGIQAEQQRLQAEQEKKERYQDYAKMIGMGAVNGGMGIGAGLVQGADKGLGTLTSMTKQLMSGRPMGMGTAVGDAIVSGGLALKPVEDSIATSLGVNERNGTLDPEAVGTVKGLEYYQSKRRIGAFNQNMNDWLEQSLGEGVNKDNLLDALDRLDADGRAEFADKFTLMIDKERNRIKAKEYAGQKLDAVDRAVLDSYSDVAGKIRQVATWRGREEHNEATAASYQATSIRAELERSRQAHRRAINHMAAEVNDPSFKDVRKKVMFNAIKSKAYYDEDNGMSYFKYDDNGDWTVDESKLDRGAYTKIRHDLEDMALNGTIDAAGRLYLWDVRHRFNETQDSRSQQRHAERDMWADNISYGTPLDDYYADCHRKNKLPSDINLLGVPKTLMKGWDPISDQIKDIRDDLMAQEENKALGGDELSWYKYLSQSIGDIPPEDQEDFRRAVRLQNTLTLIKVSQKYDDLKRLVENDKNAGIGRFQNEWAEFYDATRALQEGRPISMMEDDAPFRSGGNGPAEQRFVKAYNRLCKAILKADLKDKGLTDYDISQISDDKDRAALKKQQDNAVNEFYEHHPHLNKRLVKDIFGPTVDLDETPTAAEGPAVGVGSMGDDPPIGITGPEQKSASAGMLDAEGLTFGELFPIVKSKLGLSDEDTVRFIKHNVENVGAIDDKESFLKALKKAQEEKQSAPQVPKVQKEPPQSRSQDQDQDPLKDWAPGKELSDEGAKYYARIKDTQGQVSQRYIPPYLRNGGRYPPKGNPSPGGEGVSQKGPASGNVRYEDYVTSGKKALHDLFSNNRSPQSKVLNANVRNILEEMVRFNNYTKDSEFSGRDLDFVTELNDLYQARTGQSIWGNRRFGEAGNIIRAMKLKKDKGEQISPADALLEGLGLDKDEYGDAAKFWVEHGLGGRPRVLSTLEPKIDSSGRMVYNERGKDSQKEKYKALRGKFDREVTSPEKMADGDFQTKINRLWREFIAREALYANMPGDDYGKRFLSVKSKILPRLEDITKGMSEEEKARTYSEVQNLIDSYLEDYREGNFEVNAYKDGINEMRNLSRSLEARANAHIDRMGYAIPWKKGVDAMLGGLDWIRTSDETGSRPLTLDDLKTMDPLELEKVIEYSARKKMGVTDDGKITDTKAATELTTALNGLEKGMDFLERNHTASFDKVPPWVNGDPRFERYTSDKKALSERFNLIKDTLNRVLIETGGKIDVSAQNEETATSDESKPKVVPKKKKPKNIFDKRTTMPSDMWQVNNTSERGAKGYPINEVWKDPDVDFDKVKWEDYVKDPTYWISNRFMLPLFRDYVELDRSGKGPKEISDGKKELIDDLVNSVDDRTLMTIKNWLDVIYSRAACKVEYEKNPVTYKQNYENALRTGKSNHLYFDPDDVKESKYNQLGAHHDMLRNIRGYFMKRYNERLSKRT